MSWSSPSSDTIVATFTNPRNGNQLAPVSFITSYTVEDDFWNSVGSFTFVIEQDKNWAFTQMKDLRRYLSPGFRIDMTLNNIPIFKGYIGKPNLAYDSNRGLSLTIKGRNYLGIIADSTVFPYVAVDNSTMAPMVQFPTDTTFQTALELLLVDGTNITQLVTTDAGNLPLSSGGIAGFKNGRGTRKGLKPARLTNAIAHIMKPNVGEGRLQYAQRIADLIGAHIRMIPGTSICCVMPPIYDRDGGPIYDIRLVPGDATSNATSMMEDIDWDKQCDALIVQSNVGGQNFRRDLQKCICINDITGYDRDSNNMATGIKQDILDTTNFLTSNNNYLMLGPNEYPYAQLPANVQGLPSIVSRVEYVEDDRSFTPEHLQYYTALRMAKIQDKFFRLKYTIPGHTTLKGDPWQTNMMCNVRDDIINPGDGSSNKQYWIAKRSFTKSTAGTKTNIELTLPYIYLFDME